MAREILEVSSSRGDAALPALQILCQELHLRAQRTPSGRITGELYRDLGGAPGALRRWVEERLADPAYAYAGAMARRMLRSLTVKEEGRERYARPRAEDEVLDFPDRAAARRTLERLLADHLVLREKTGDAHLEIRLASEVICPLVDTWQEEPDELERASRMLSRACRNWMDHGRRAEDLLGGVGLDLVQRHAAALADTTPAERAFLEDSIAHRRRRRALALVTSGGVMAIILALIYMGFLRPGRVRLESTPPGATVSLDSRTLGTTPLVLQTTPGTYRLLFSKEAHRPETRPVQVLAGAETTEGLTLAYPAGRLRVETEPPGARMVLERIDGPAGAPPYAWRTPVTTEVPEGSYRMTLVSTGHLDLVTGPIRVEPNRVLTARLDRLVPNVGGLSVDSPFEGVELSVRSAGKTAEEAARVTLPTKSPLMLVAGSYDLVASRAGSPPWHARVAVERGRTATWTAWVPPVEVAREFAGDGFAMTWHEPTVVDLDGDGVPETVHRSTGFGPDVEHLQASAKGVHVLSGATGRELWSLEETPTGPPATADADGDGRVDLILELGLELRAVSGSTGKTIWTFAHDRGARIEDLRLPGPAAVVIELKADTLALSLGKTVAAVSVRTGKPVWEAPQQAHLAVAFPDLDADGARDVILNVPESGRRSKLVCLSGANGKVLWSTDAASELVAEACLQRALLVVSGRDDPAITSLVPSTGKPLWRRPGEFDARLVWPTADLDADGWPDLLAEDGGSALVAISGKDGRELWRKGSRQAVTPMAHGDVDGDGRPDVLAAGATDLHALSGRDGSQLWSSPGEPRGVAVRDGSAVVAESGRVVGLSLSSGAVSWSFPLEPEIAWHRPMLSDVDGDGLLEILAGTYVDRPRSELDPGGKVVALRPPRAARWAASTRGQISAEPAIGDLDADGYPDPVTCSWDRTVLAVSGATGRVLWRVALPERVPLGAVLADLDGDRRPEVLLACRDGAVHVLSGIDGRHLARIPTANQFTEGAAPEASPLAPASLKMGRTEYAVSGSGGEMPSGPAPEGSGLPPAAGDLDGDGRMDLVVHGEPLEAIRTGSKDRLWTVNPGTSPSAPVLHDVNGDGSADLVLAWDWHLGAFDGRTGKPLWKHPHQLARGWYDWCPTPLIGRLAGGGDLVVQATKEHVAAVDAGTGAPRWKAGTGGDVVLTPRVRALGAGFEVVLCVRKDGGTFEYVVLAGEDGRERHRWPATRKPVALNVGDADGDGVADLLVRTAHTNDQQVQVLSGTTGKSLFTASSGPATPEATVELQRSHQSAPRIHAAPALLVTADKKTRLLLSVHAGRMLLATPLPGGGQ